jgi:proteasome activator subunit 4
MAGTLLYVPVLLPRVVQMQEINDDQDLQQMATHVLTLMAQMTYPPQMIPSLVDQLITILTTSTSWHIRARTLPLLQIFFFKHLFSLDTEQQVVCIMQAVSTLLLDTQIEVRTMASITLGGIVRCSQRGAIDSLRSRYTALLKDTKLPKQYRDERGKLMEPEGFRDAVLQKHAGALGLSCLVNAFPYEIPEWLPTVLCQLADCMSDPAEIQVTQRL